MPDGSFAHPQQRQFNPYTDNGGTILAIAGADFTVIAGDTRQSEGYSIQTRYAPKVFRLCVAPIHATGLGDADAAQDGQGGAGGEWVRGGRQHVCEESQATARGVYE